MKESLEALRRMMQVSPQVQLLFEEDRLAAFSPEALRLFPSLREGEDAQALLGQAAGELRNLGESDSGLFSVEICGIECDVTAAAVEGYRLVTVCASQARESEELCSAARYLRETMTGILAVSPNLFPKLEETTEVMRCAASMNRDFYRILRIIENMELCGGESPAPNFQTFDAEHWFTGLGQRLDDICGLAGWKLKSSFSGPSRLIRMDSMQVQKAVLQLVSNSVKFSSEGTKIFLSAVCGKTLRICVSDEGGGIPEDRLSRIFSGGGTGEAVPDPRWGAGMGLGAVRRIMHLHGGSMMIQSRSGEGTRVYLSIPYGQTGDDPELQTPALMPEDRGVDPYLVGLADVLPAEVFDTRGIDL